jgi:hypothetical protein
MNSAAAYSTLVDLMSFDSRFKRAVASNSGAEYAVASLRGRSGFDCEVGIVALDSLGVGEHGLLVRVETRPVPLEATGEKLDAFLKFKELSFEEQDVLLMRRSENLSEILVLARVLTAFAVGKKSVVAVAEQLADSVDVLEQELARNFDFEFHPFD